MGDNPHENHRARMHERGARTGRDDFAPHEVLEYLLYLAIPRQDTNPLAHRLLDQFGSLSAVLEASEEELLRVPGIGPKSARVIRTVMQVGRCYQLDRIRKKRKFTNTAELIEYCIPLFYGLSDERFYMIGVDDDFRMIRTMRLWDGAVNSLSVTSRRVAQEALKMGATGVVVAHNHPAGLAIPSAEDIMSTTALKDTLESVSIVLHDHIIVAGSEALSMKQSRRQPWTNGYY